MTTLTATNGCRIYLSAVGCQTVRVPVASLRQASAVWAQYRDDNGIGSSDMKRNCGTIFGNDGKTVVARVSYNGRIWDQTGALLEESD